MMSNNDVSQDGEGVRASRARKRRLWLLLLVIIALGAAVDAIVIPIARHAPPGGPFVPPLIAMLAAAILVLLLTVGVWLHFRWADELDRQHNVAAFTVGYVFNIGAFIAWSVLWTGGLVRAPSAYLLFISTGAVGFLAYCWMKLKTHFG